MSDPADSPVPRSEDAERRPAGDEVPPEAPPEPPESEAPPEPSRSETPMEDSRPEVSGEPPVPAQAEPAPIAPAQSVPVQAETSQPEPAPAHAAAAQPPVNRQAAPAQPPPGPYQQPQYQQPHPGQSPQPPSGPYYQGPRTPMFLPNPRWHRPESTPRQFVVVMAVAVALFGGWAAFHGDGVGIGLALTGIALVAVPLVAGDRRDLMPRLPGAVLVAALWSVAAIRDAGWVVTLCSLAAFLLTPLVLAPQRRFSGTFITMGMGWLEGLAESFKWARRGRRGKDGRDPTAVRNVWVTLVTVALLLVFGGLFATADSTFADLVARLLPEVNPFEFFVRTLLAAVLFPLVLMWIYTAVAKPGFDSQGTDEHRTVSRFELTVPLVALNLLFAAFIAVQLRVFLGGEGYVMETEGLTFAEYARKGFWQLSFVAMLSLAVIAVAAWLAPKREKADRWTARILLGSLCLLSMVVIASALYRMYTYFETYGLTRMRIWVFTVEIWLAVLFALVIVCCWKLRATWLPRAVLASGALTLLGLAAVNPDALIARHNIEHERQLDVRYLSNLSDDAVPEFTELSGDDLECALDRPASDDERELMAWNLGWQRAQDFFDDQPGGNDSSTSYTDCSRPYDGSYDGAIEDDWEAERPGDAATTEAETFGSNGFFHWDTCAMYDFDQVTALFGTSAGGDRGVVPDDPSQYAEELSPADGRGERVLHCGYYGPGSRYLMIEAYEWPSANEAVGGVQAMQTERENSGFYTVAALESETTTGYTAIIDAGSTDYEYAVAIDDLVVVVSLSDSAVDASADAVASDFVDQTHMLHFALA